jgi:hypothetical protein
MKAESLVINSTGHRPVKMADRCVCQAESLQSIRSHPFRANVNTHHQTTGRCPALTTMPLSGVAQRAQRICSTRNELSIVNCQLSILRRCLVIALLFTGLLSRSMAQEIRLNGKDNRNRETVSVRLYDNNEGNYLVELPLTFHITQNNILFMFVGDDNGINGSNAVWMFDKTIPLNDFLKKNKHIGTAKTFKKQLNRLESFFDQSENIERYTRFDNGFEQVQASPKPVFFKVGDPSKPVVLKLKFYTSSEKNDRSQELTAEAGTVKITINL